MEMPAGLFAVRPSATFLKLPVGSTSSGIKTEYDDFALNDAKFFYAIYSRNLLQLGGGDAIFILFSE